MLFQAASVLLAAYSASAAAIVQRQTAITQFGDTSPIAWSYPPGRGFYAENADDAPCGGFALGARTQYPLTGGDLAFTQIANLTNVNVLYTNETDPSRFHSFDFYSNTIEALGAGHYCTKAPDFASLGFTAGSNATMLVIYQLGEASSYYYQCADVSLVETSAWTAPSEEYVCGNYTRTLEEASAEESLGNAMGGSHGSNSTSNTTQTTSSGTTGSIAAESSAVVASSSESNDGLSAAAGGGIGAAVTLLIIAILLALGVFTGFLSLGKKKNSSNIRADDASSSSGVPGMKQTSAA